MLRMFLLFVYTKPIPARKRSRDPVLLFFFLFPFHCYGFTGWLVFSKFFPLSLFSHRCKLSDPLIEGYLEMKAFPLLQLVFLLNNKKKPPGDSGNAQRIPIFSSVKANSSSSQHWYAFD